MARPRAYPCVPVPQSTSRSASSHCRLSLLTGASLINRSDLLAEQHAVKQMPLHDVVALGLVRGGRLRIAEAGGFEVADLERAVSSELAVRLVLERIARRHFGAAHGRQRRLTYATSQPFNAQAQRDVACACEDGRESSPRRDRPTQHARPLLRSCASSTSCHPAALEGRDRRKPRPGDDTKSDPVVVDVCNHLIGRAVEVGASDVQAGCDSTVRTSATGLTGCWNGSSRCRQPLEAGVRAHSRSAASVTGTPQAPE